MRVMRVPPSRSKPRDEDEHNACLRKIAYPTWDEAEAVCLRLLFEDGQDRRAYRCDYGDHWHTSRFKGLRGGQPHDHRA
jgi:hypothetical protein